MEIDPVAAGMSMFASEYDENLAAFNTPPVGWLERYRAAYRAQKEGWSKLLFGPPASPLPSGVPAGVPVNPLGWEPELATLNPDGTWPHRHTKYIGRLINKTGIPAVVKDAVSDMNAFAIPTEAHSAGMTREQWALARSSSSATPDPDRVWFEKVYEAELKRRINLATTKLWEYFTFPLRDRAGVFHFSRLSTPWVYYKDLNVYDLFQAFVFPVVGAAVMASAAWALGTWAGPFFAAVFGSAATAASCTSALSLAVTNLLKSKIRVPREIREALAITSADVYDGSKRTRLPALTAPAAPLDPFRNLAREFPVNLFSHRGMNKTVTFSRVQSCH